MSNRSKIDPRHNTRGSCLVQIKREPSAGGILNMAYRENAWEKWVGRGSGRC